MFPSAHKGHPAREGAAGPKFPILLSTGGIRSRPPHLDDRPTPGTSRHESRSIDGGRRLPRPQRCHPRGRPARRQRGGLLHRHPRRLARPRSGNEPPPRPHETDGIIARGGTILGSSRTNPFKNAATDLPALQANFEALGLDALVAIGGDDTLGVGHRLYNDFGLPMVGVPKTIDNDLMVTDFTFGFDTAINIVTEAVDRLRTTTESHRRIMVVETMGRHAGWIACFSGIAVAADYILVPEVPIDIPHARRRAQAAAGGGQELRDRHRLRRGRLPRPGALILDETARPLRPRPARRRRQRGRQR